MEKRILSLLMAFLMLFAVCTGVSAATEVTPMWKNFRNSDNNMAIVDEKTPVGMTSAMVKWIADPLGENAGFTDYTGYQIILKDDAGKYLVMTRGSDIIKMNAENGAVIASSPLTIKPSYAIVQPTYAEGIVYVPLNKGVIDAFDAKTLEKEWTFGNPESGLGQGVSPILYADGNIYTGFWASGKDADFVCIDAKTGELKWKYASYSGFYWAGAVAVGDYIIVGSEDNEKKDAVYGAANVYVFKKNYAEDEVVEPVHKVTLEGFGDIRSSMAYANDKVYFTTTAGYLASLNVDKETGELTGLVSKKYDYRVTSTPVVYGDEVYVGLGSAKTNGDVIAADADSLELIWKADLALPVQASLLVSEAYYEETGKLYMYATYNYTPGGIVLLKVDPENNTFETEDLYIPPAEDAEYSIMSIVCDDEGVLYYKNDSNKVFAIKPTAEIYMESLSANTGNYTYEFDKNTYEYELVVPIGTTEVEFTAEANGENTFTLNGTTNMTVTLTGGVATAVFAVTDGKDTREYTVNIRTISDNAALGELSASGSNTYGSAPLYTISPSFDKNMKDYTFDDALSGKSFVRLWADAEDIHADVKVYAVDNVKTGKFDAETKEISSALSKEHHRYGIYIDDVTKPAVVQVVVTSEDGQNVNTYTVSVSYQAEQVTKQIDSLGEITLESEQAVIDARAAYDALTDNQQTFVTNVATLEAAEMKIAELKKQVADEAAADAVAEMIDAIGEVTLGDEDAVSAAKEAYGALTEEQKALVENYGVLADAEAALNTLKDEAADVQAMIDSIGEVTKENATEKEAQVTAAKEAYDALTGEQKALVENYGVLAEAEAVLEDFKTEIADVQAMIDSIGEITKENVTEKEAQVAAAKEAYDALTEEQKALVASDALEEAETLLGNIAQALTYEGKLAGLSKDSVTEATAEDIKAIIDEYDSLDEEVKVLVSEEAVKLVEELEDAYNDVMGIQAPATGDKMTVILVAAMFIMFAVMIAIVLGKRRESQK